MVANDLREKGAAARTKEMFDACGKFDEFDHLDLTIHSFDFNIKSCG